MKKENTIKWLVCTCTNSNHNVSCDWVRYYPQDIAKAERLANDAGFPGFLMPYKVCVECHYKGCQFYGYIY